MNISIKQSKILKSKFNKLMINNGVILSKEVQTKKKEIIEEAKNHMKKENVDSKNNESVTYKSN